MTTATLTPEQLSALAALANGIIPADDMDAGAAAVDAAARLATKIENGQNAGVYLTGLASAEALAQRQFGVSVPALNPAQLHALIGLLRTDALGFYKQLRLDVCALYLGDPAVWPRIGFPGPSAETGGYLDFDQRQSGFSS